MKSKIKKREKIILGLGILCVFLIYFSYIFFLGTKNSEAGIIFNEAAIHGKLSYCFSDNQGTYITINNKEKYWFLPVRKSNNKFLTFCRDSDIGDIVIKKSYAPILYLVKENGDTISYEFVRFYRNGEKKIIGE